MFLSLVIPIHKEGKLVNRNLESLIGFMENGYLKGSYEIVVVSNGSRNRPSLGTSSPKVKLFSLRRRGLGLALKEGMKRSKGDLIMYYAIDLPFGLRVISDSVKAALGGNDLVLGSKGHPKSVVSRGAYRNIVSAFLNFLFRHVFGLQVRDTQGTFLLSKTLYKKTARYLSSGGPWIQAQVVLYASCFGGKICEIPVRYITEKRVSRMKLSDGVHYVIEMFSELPSFLNAKNKR